MTGVRVSCPFCNKSLRLREVPSNGRRLLCPGCNRTFAVRSEMFAPVEPSGAPRRAPAPPPVPSSAPLPSSVLVPIAPPTATAAPEDAPVNGSGRLLLLGGIVGGLVLLIGSTVLALALAARQDQTRRQDVVADNTKKNDDLDEKQTWRTDTPRPRQRDDEVVPTPRPRDRQISQPEPLPPVLPPPALPRELQDKVNKAIDSGVDYLKKKQLPNGSWENNNATGLAALPALTLLECGVPAKDEQIQRAAQYVRTHVSKLMFGTTTYETSLAILFLDRLGDAKDRPLIRSLAMRIIAGQQADGGWSYHLPMLQAEDEKKLMEFLERTRPSGALEGFTKLKDGERRSLDFPDGPSSKPDEKSGSTLPFGKPLTAEEAKKEIDNLPLNLRTIPAAANAGGRLPNPNQNAARSDNSNTQFATLGLWAARRHAVPMERSLDLLAKRFQDSQASDGTWGYYSHTPGATPAMTGCGLLGLAVGHGVTTDPTRRSKVKDERINKGLKALGKALVDSPDRTKKRTPNRIRFINVRDPNNLYFLWTVERVGVLYDVKDLDGKDWYRWGVDLLLPNQGTDGSWHLGGYHGSTKTIDTCFALLFLKRANLASDLTRRLEFMVEGKPER